MCGSAGLHGCSRSCSESILAEGTTSIKAGTVAQVLMGMPGLVAVGHGSVLSVRLKSVDAG